MVLGTTTLPLGPGTLTPPAMSLPVLATLTLLSLIIAPPLKQSLGVPIAVIGGAIATLEIPHFLVGLFPITGPKGTPFAPRLLDTRMEIWIWAGTTLTFAIAPLLVLRIPIVLNLLKLPAPFVIPIETTVWLVRVAWSSVFVIATHLGAADPCLVPKFVGSVLTNLIRVGSDPIVQALTNKLKHARLRETIALPFGMETRTGAPGQLLLANLLRLIQVPTPLSCTSIRLSWPTWTPIPISRGIPRVMRE